MPGIREVFRALGLLTHAAQRRRAAAHPVEVLAALELEVVALAAAVAIAMLVPARRAISVDPALVLRQE